MGIVLGLCIGTFVRVRRLLATTLLFLLGLGCVGPGTVLKRTWIEVSTPNFTIWSCQSEGATLELARDLELFRSVVEFIDGRPLPVSPVPIRVYAFDNLSYGSIKPQEMGSNVRGFFQQTMRENVIVLSPAHRDATGVIQHEYVHFLLQNHGDFIYPPWYHEGFAEFLSTVQLERGKVEIGKPVRGMSGLSMGRWTPLEKLLGATDARKVSVTGMYGESWALVHYLYVGREGEGRAVKQLTDYFRARERGLSVEDSVQRGFGLSVDQLESELRKYVRRKRFKFVAVGLENFDLGATPTVRSLAPAEVSIVMGQLSLRWGRSDQALQYFQEALLLDPTSPRAGLGLANTHRAANRGAQAEVEYGAVLEAAPDDAVVHLDYANFLYWQARATTDAAARAQLARRARRHYVKSWKLDGSVPETYAGYGATFLLEGQPAEKGFKTLQHAHEVLPSSFEIRIGLARMYWALGRPAEARRMLLTVFGYTHDEAQRKEVEEILAETGGVPGSDASDT